MKTTLVLLIASLTLNASSCKKNGGETTETTITGTWKLVLMTGGIGSVHITADQWGHSRSYELHADGTYTKRQDGKPTSGKYTLGEETQRGTNDKVNTVILDGTEKFSYSFAHDTLVLSMYGISDPMYDWYVKE